PAYRRKRGLSFTTSSGTWRELLRHTRTARARASKTRVQVEHRNRGGRRCFIWNASLRLDLTSRDFVNPVRALWRAIAQMVYGTAKNTIAPAPKASAGTATSVIAV